MRLRLVLLLAAVALLAGSAYAGAAAPPWYASPGVSPAGANDDTCRPTAAHPSPVVLVHGTFGDQTVSWNLIAPALKAQGYCVFALDYGARASGDIPASAQQLATFVDHVLAVTGAAKVSIIGHSQGGMMPRYYVKNLGGLGKVDDLIGLAPSNHGTTNPAAPYGDQWAGCVSCGQQVAGSSFITALNSGDEAPAPVDYTVVETSHDEVVTPYSSAFLTAAAGASNVTNVLLQDRCAEDVSEHLGIIYDPVALQWILDALGHAGPADAAFKPVC